MENTNQKLSFKEKVGYSLGDTASHFVWDMAIDPVIGVVSDRTNTRWGKFRPYILFGAIPYAVLAILTFTTPDFGEAGKIIYAGATYVLLMTAYAAINLPYSALAAVMTSDTYERALFADMGNIWTIRDYSGQSGGQFKPLTFYEQLAGSIGFGIRIDFGYFLARVDLGMKVFDPSMSGNDRWRILSIDNSDDFAIHLAFGYPF